MKGKIEHGVPVPARKWNGTRGYKYGFHLLADGDSVFFPVKSKKKQTNISIAASQYGIRNNLKIVTRREKDNGIRVWRVGVKNPVDTTGENP